MNISSNQASGNHHIDRSRIFRKMVTWRYHHPCFVTKTTYMLRRLFIVSSLVICSNAIIAQKKTDRYCEVQSYKLGFSKFMHATISFGQNEKQFTDSAKSVEYTRYLNKINSNADILNYMATDGWYLVSSSIVKVVNVTFVFYFKKEFQQAE